MRAAQKFLLLLLPLIVFLLPTKVFADNPTVGQACFYPQNNSSGQTEICQGTYQKEDFTACYTCQYTSGVNPNCEPAAGSQNTPSQSYCPTTTPTPTPSSTPTPSATPTPVPGSTTPTATPAPTAGNDVAAKYKAPQHTDYTFANMGHSVVCFISDPKEGYPPNQPCLGMDSNGQITFNNQHKGGALGFVNNTMVAMYSNPPVSSSYFLADLGSNLGLVKPVYAQNVGGSGEAIIKPVYKLWQVTRNISYLIFTLVFVVVGFMIMFRSKINPQTVISVQQALPGLVIGLILVTFSYFIASFIVDISFVGMQLVAYLFQSTNLDSVQKASVVASNSNIFNLFWSFTGGILGKTFSTLVSLLTPSREFTQTALTANPLTMQLGLLSNFIPGIADVTSKGIGIVIGGIAGVLVSAIILIALLIQMLKLLWGLVSAYISILVFSVLGPLIILVSSIPGRGGVLSFWWKTLLANVLIFPAVFAAFLFAAIILGNTGDFQSALPLFAGLPVDVLKLIIGVGIILGTPAIPKMVKDALGVKDIAGIPQAAAGGILAGLGAARSAGRTGFAAPLAARERWEKTDQGTSPVATAIGRNRVVGGIIKGVFGGR